MTDRTILCSAHYAAVCYIATNPPESFTNHSSDIFKVRANGMRQKGLTSDCQREGPTQPLQHKVTASFTDMQLIPL